MKSVRVRRCPAADLPSCAGAEWADRSRHVYVEGGTAWVPVREGFAWDDDLPGRSRPAPRGFQRLGDAVLFHGSRPDIAAVEEAVARCAPSCVLWVRGHGGAERVPDVEVLCGIPREVVVRENGLSYRLDPMRVMFSGGNRGEKRRLAGQVRPGERTADLFAGIGYFTLPLARAGASVHAMEINPVAFHYLGENLVENGLAGRADVDCGDCRDLLSGIYDRLVLGHFDATAFLRDALAHVRGGSILHVHGLERVPGALAPALEATARECGIEVALSCRPVKKYGPGTVHTVHDMVIL